MSWFSKWRQRASNNHEDLQIMRSDDGRIMLPGPNPTDGQIRAAVAQWIELMAHDDYESAVAAVFSDPPEPDDFRERVETFCIALPGIIQGITEAFAKEGIETSEQPAVEPGVRARVVSASPELLDEMEIERAEASSDAAAWIGFHLLLDNNFGIWTTMTVSRAGDRCVLQFDMFHL